MAGAESPKFEVTSLGETELVPYLMEKLQVIAAEAISSRGVFILGVSGKTPYNTIHANNLLMNMGWTWTKPKGAHEKFSSFFTYGRKKMYAGSARFMQF
jgi:hypothetical protein